MKRTFFGRWALVILCVVVFFVPFALRGARMGMQRMANNIKDWLPADFDETRDLEWFGKHFMGEQFVVVTWPGCTADDPRYQKLVDKLRHELAAPPEKRAGADGSKTHEGPAPKPRPFEELTEAERAEVERYRARETGDSLALTVSAELYENWGQRGEKWLRGDRDQWYFITPSGELFRWHGRSNLPGVMLRAVQRNVFGQKLVEGELVTRFGKPPTDDQPNEFFAAPEKLTARLFKSITTGPDTLAMLASKDGPLWPRGVDDEFAAQEARAKALDRLRGTLFGADGEQTCLILTLSEVGKRDLKRVLGRPLLGRPPGRLLDLACNHCAISPDDLKLGGPPVDNVAIDEEGQITLVRLIALSVVVGLVLAYLSVRSIQVMLMLFFIGGVGAIASLANVWWTGGYVDSIMMSMPSMVYVLGISGSLHLYNYYREEVEHRGYVGAPEKMLSLGWKASFLCAVSNALGLVSLYTSDLAPIRNFGVYTAAAVMGILVLMWTYLPAALEVWPPKLARRPEGEQAEEKPTALEQKLDRFWERFGGFILRRWGLVTAGCLLVIGLGCLGIPMIRTSVHLIKFFDRKSKIIQDYAWLENHLAKLVPMELVVRVPPENLRSVKPAAGAAEAVAGGAGGEPLAAAKEARFGLDFLERMELAARVQQVVEREFGETGKGIVGRAMAIPTFAPELPAPGFSTLRNPVRSVMNRKLEEHRDEYLASDYLRMDRDEKHAGSELWRISLRVGALREIDYGRFVGELKRVVEPVMAAYRYREQVLRGLDAHSAGRGFVKARVAFLGLRDPAEKAAAEHKAKSDAVGPRNEVPGPGDQPVTFVEEDTTTAAEVDQTQIFAQTLQNLMTCAGVTAKKGSWHDPEADPQDKAYYTSAAWGELLAQRFDCVVLVRDNPAYDLDFLRQHARLFIDARDHQFDPASGTAVTAVERQDPIHVVYTGAVPLVYKAQRSLLESLIESVFWSFVTITPLMMWLARGIGAGIVAMLPNALPVVIVFGGLGWLGIDVDVGSMMTASIALGVAVDDTIHFLTWFREDLDRLGDRHKAILAAYKRCATPTLQAAFISGLGLSVFALSTFTPTQRFGYLMLTILIAGVIAELILYPALLSGPLGRFCVPHKDPWRWAKWLLRRLRLGKPRAAEPPAARAAPEPADAALPFESAQTGDGLPPPHLREPDTVGTPAHRRVDPPHKAQR